jgi:hypothetical protein
MMGKSPAECFAVFLSSTDKNIFCIQCGVWQYTPHCIYLTRYGLHINIPLYGKLLEFVQE